MIDCVGDHEHGTPVSPMHILNVALSTILGAVTDKISKKFKSSLVFHLMKFIKSIMRLCKSQKIAYYAPGNMLNALYT